MTVAGWLELPDGSQVRHSAISRTFSRGEIAEGTGVFEWQVWATVVGVSELLALSATPFATKAEADAFMNSILVAITPPAPVATG
jgi:hypothetical protein